jgi:hypothetical protein
MDCQISNKGALSNYIAYNAIESLILELAFPIKVKRHCSRKLQVREVCVVKNYLQRSTWKYKHI